MNVQFDIVKDLVQRLALGALVLLLAFSPVLAQEITGEKNEPIEERCVFMNEQVASEIDVRKSRETTTFPDFGSTTFNPIFSRSNGLNHSKLFILYHRLKLCD